MGLRKNEFLAKKRYWLTALLVSVIAFSIFGVLAYQGLTTPKYVIEKESSSLYTVKGWYDWSAEVKKENPIWSAGEKLEHRSLYFTGVAPELKGTIDFQISSPSSMNITTVYQLKWILSSSGKDITYWSKERMISSGEVPGGKEIQIEFRLNMTETEREIKAIKESLKFYGGETELKVLATVSYQGKIGTEKVNGVKEISLSIKPRGSYYEISAKLFEETIKKEIVRQVAIQPSGSEKAVLITPPAILLLAIIALAAMKLKYKPLTESEIEELKRKKEHQRFREQISLGKCPSLLDLEKKAIEINSLKDLVQLAIDTDKRVISDPERKIYFVIADDIIYFFKEGK